MNLNNNLNINHFSSISNSDVAVITLHGYLESCYTMSYFNEYLKNCNFNVESPNLLGHAGKYTDLHEIKYHEWINQVENIYKNFNRKNKKIIIIGYSLGGTLALYLAEHFEIAGLVLINHLFNHLPFSMKLTPIGKYFIKYVPNIKPDIKNNEQLFTYNQISSWNTAEIIKLSKIVKSKISKLSCPTLIFKSKNDHRVSKSNSFDTYKKIQSKNKQIILLENSYHIAPLDYEKDFIIKEIKKFINEVIK